MSMRRSATTNPWRTPERVSGRVLQMGRASSEVSSATFASTSDELVGITLESVDSNTSKTFMRNTLDRGVIKLIRGFGTQAKIGEAMYPCRVMSKEHAMISFPHRGGVYLTDSGSYHGTYVNRQGVTIQVQAASKRRIQQGDIIIMGRKVVNDDQTVRPLELRVKLLYQSSLAPEMQLNSSSPNRYNRYIVPMNIGDTTSESESETGDHDSIVETPTPVRTIAPLPSRARNGLGAQAISPSPLRSAMLPMMPLGAASSPNSGSRGAGSSLSPSKRPRILDEFLDQMESVKTAISSMTTELNNIRLTSSESGQLEKKKYDDIQAMLSGFQQQQVQMARDHGEQMELIRKLKDKMEKEKEDVDQMQSDSPKREKEHVKRKVDDANLDATSTPTDFAEIGFAQDPHADLSLSNSISMVSLSQPDGPSYPLANPEEADSSPLLSSPALLPSALVPTAECPSQVQPQPPRLIPGSRAQIRRRRRLAPLVTNTIHTIGTLGVGAAMMWYGLSELNL